ncbi:hypothetical protein VZT92_002072 [Zoarces viviparus]|uniref:Gag protein n=1 Tax=Zoarces viviparus TaxID=48416 RepID=A0AAW1G4G6_ZOAVI
MEDLMRELVRMSAEQQTLNRAMIQEQRQQNAFLHAEVQKCMAAAPPALREGTVQPNPSRFIPKMTESDDIEAYLTAFERTAKREGWPDDSWADLVGPFLLGPAQQAYLDLTTDQAKDYAVLKKEILARYGYSLAASRGSMTGDLNQNCQPGRKCMTSAG